MKKIFTFISIVMLASCGQMDNKKEADTKQPAAIANTPVDDWKIIAKDNYSIKYPSTWELDTLKKGRSLFMVVSPLESDTDRYREAINLVTEDITGKGMDMDAYVNASITGIKSVFTDYNQIEGKKIQVGSVEYYKLHYTAKQNGNPIELEQWIRIDKDKAYILSFAMEYGKYNEHKEIGEKILSTFTIKN